MQIIINKNKNKWWIRNSYLGLIWIRSTTSKIYQCSWQSGQPNIANTFSWHYLWDPYGGFGNEEWRIQSALPSLPASAISNKWPSGPKAMSQRKCPNQLWAVTMCIRHSHTCFSSEVGQVSKKWPRQPIWRVMAEYGMGGCVELSSHCIQSLRPQYMSQM